MVELVQQVGTLVDLEQRGKNVFTAARKETCFHLFRWGWRQDPSAGASLMCFSHKIILNPQWFAGLHFLQTDAGRSKRQVHIIISMCVMSASALGSEVASAPTHSLYESMHALAHFYLWFMASTRCQDKPAHVRWAKFGATNFCHWAAPRTINVGRVFVEANSKHRAAHSEVPSNGGRPIQTTDVKSRENYVLSCLKKLLGIQICGVFYHLKIHCSKHALCFFPNISSTAVAQWIQENI